VSRENMVREEQRQARLSRLERADEQFPRLQAMAERAGLSLEKPSERHWQVRAPDRTVLVNYWPSTQKQQNSPTEKARTRVSLEDFEYKLRLLCSLS